MPLTHLANSFQFLRTTYLENGRAIVWPKKTIAVVQCITQHQVIKSSDNARGNDIFCYAGALLTAEDDVLEVLATAGPTKKTDWHWYDGRLLTQRKIPLFDEAQLSGYIQATGIAFGGMHHESLPDKGNYIHVLTQIWLI
jgi:hypothetical protein